MAVSQDEELVVTELTLLDHVHPFIADEHVIHLVDNAVKHQSLPELRFESEDGVALVNFHEAKFLEEIVRLPTHSLLHLRLEKLHLSWDINQFVCHARLACLRIHTVVAILQGVSLLLVLNRAVPWQDVAKETSSFRNEFAALMALVLCELVPITFTGFFCEELFLGLRSVLLVLDFVVEVVEEDNVRVCQLPLRFATDAGQELHSVFVALFLRHQRIDGCHWNSIAVYCYGSKWLRCTWKSVLRIVSIHASSFVRITCLVATFVVRLVLPEYFRGLTILVCHDPFYDAP